MVRAVLLAFEMIHAVAALQGHIMRDCVNLTKPLSLAGVRAPPGQQLLHGGGDDGCDAGFCAGATRLKHPISPRAFAASARSPIL